MRFGCVAAVGTAFANTCLAHDQRWPLGRVASLGNSLGDNARVVPIYRSYHIPPVSHKTQSRVVYEPGCDLAVDRDAVVVVQGDQFVELPCTRQSGSFMADAFHHATVTHEDIGVVIDHIQTVTVELAGQQFFRQRHTYGIGKALPKRAGGGLHTRRYLQLGMARSFAM